MAVVVGTNAGFVTARPTADPGGSGTTVIDTKAMAFRFTAPVGAVAINEIGWYSYQASEAANFQVGIYADDGAGETPGTQIAASGDAAKGTTGGWKYIALAAAVTAGTAYWLAVQVDDTDTYTYAEYDSGTGDMAAKFAATGLVSPWGASDDTCASRDWAVYAVYTTAAGGSVVVKASIAARRRNG